MLIAGPRYAPMLLPEPGVGKLVHGELFQVDEQTLKTLDELESIGRPGNLRLALEIAPIDGGLHRIAQAYLKDRALAVPEHSGYLAEYYRDQRFISPSS
jgi:gamma-glutamylaminecyclotransferase